MGPWSGRPVQQTANLGRNLQLLAVGIEPVVHLDAEERETFRGPCPHERRVLPRFSGEHQHGQTAAGAYIDAIPAVMVVDVDVEREVGRRVAPGARHAGADSLHVAGRFLRARSGPILLVAGCVIVIVDVAALGILGGSARVRC